VAFKLQALRPMGPLWGIALWVTMAVAPGDSLAVNKVEYQGWKTYNTYCDRCHGQDALGSSLAPNLRRSVGPEVGMTHDVFIRRVTDGVVDKGMPAWKGMLTPEQIESIWAYVRARSSGRLSAGRPHIVP
jgi:cytochrome c